ncbi:hypothetical protein R1T15_22005 [Mucilaginibacter sp. L3T2-6]|nr:hypothetical protein [Mucilaginibacter sp. L3T2-6]
MLRYFLLSGAFALTMATATAQKKFVNPVDTAIHVMDKQPENYLLPVKALEGGRPDTSDLLGYNYWLQAAMTYESFLGDYEKALFYADARYGNRPPTGKIVCDTAFVKTHSLVNASDYIIAQARQKQVVMINEAHHLPFHRAFVLPMLKRFYDAGYRYLAIETLGDSTINQKTYPDYQTGYYTHEPLFGELIREALRLHFKLIKYESEAQCDGKGKDSQYCNRFRDSMMAVNLSKIIKTAPNAKILVYAGYDHIHEGSENGWKKMAQFFKGFTGIDPFTVEMTRQVEHLYPQHNAGEFNAVNILKHITAPVIAIQNNQPWHGDFVDATVIFPKYIKMGKRPYFYSVGGMRKRYDLAEINVKNGDYIQAFYTNEKPGNRIPADQLVAGEGERCLYLFKGNYTIEVKDSAGSLLRKSVVAIR